MDTFAFFNTIPVSAPTSLKRSKVSVTGGQPQILMGIAGGISLAKTGKPIFTQDKSLRDFVVAVEINGNPMNSVLAFYSEPNGEVYGYIDSPVVNCRFKWDARMQPKLSHVRLQAVPALEFVRHVIQTKALEILADLPENLSGAHGAYVSQLIADGNVTRPYSRRKPNSEERIFVKGSILNPKNIDPTVLPQIIELVNTWNQLIESYRQTQDFSGFTIWSKGLKAPKVKQAPRK